MRGRRVGELGADASGDIRDAVLPGASEELGLDDWFDPTMASHIKKVLKENPDVDFKYADVKATGETWDTSTDLARLRREDRCGGRRVYDRVPGAGAPVLAEQPESYGAVSGTAF